MDMLRHKNCDTVTDTFQVDFEKDFFGLFLRCGVWNDFSLGENGIFVYGCKLRAFERLVIKAKEHLCNSS